MFLIFDTETTGFPSRYGAPHTDIEAWSTARLVQLAWQVHDEEGVLVNVENHIVRPDGFTIPYNSEQVHGISTDRAQRYGKPIKEVLKRFEADVARCRFAVGHNVEFDLGVMGAEYIRYDVQTALHDLDAVDTKLESTQFCQLPGGKGGQFKWPTLTELYTKLFNEGFDEAHNASADVEATARAFLELIRIGVIAPARLGFDSTFSQRFRTKNPESIQLIGLNVKAYEELEEEEEELSVTVDTPEISGTLAEGPFCHLHVHTQFSILQSTTDVKGLVERAKELEMPAVAMTDDANMYGAFHFTRAAKEAGIKSIVGCELNVCKDHKDKSTKDNGHSIVLLAKNKNGFHNLSKLSTAAHVDGFYYVPRIDRELLLEFKEDLIILSGGLFGEVPWLILNVGEERALEAALWYKEHFGRDFYFELCRHGIPEEKVVNEKLISWSRDHGIPLLAANNSYYTNKEDAQAQDILLCIKDAENLETPKSYASRTGRHERFGLPNDEFYLKSSTEMKELFIDVPEAIDNIGPLIDSIEAYDLSNEVLLPAFDIPEEFVHPEDAEDGGKRGENAYLRHLTYEGAKERYDEITDEIRERLDFELETIKNTGYPGYFLIVQDFTGQARKMGVSVGPGRGSAAGSAVAYCTGITNVDPIEYDLLFERFLNPDRISLPDIDIDFDDRGRDKIIDWVVQKYGKQQVAQIITYGSMAAKSSVRDASRVMGIPFDEADRVAKLIPSISLQKVFSLPDKELKQKLNDEYSKALDLKKLKDEDSNSGQAIRHALKIEGSMRNTGIHACGVIITPSDITDIIPMTTAKDSDLLVTQFDNSVVEDAGLLKMDFLGLKTLTIINDALDLIEERFELRIDPDKIPLDDEKTYELFQQGRTIGIFQYESAGMQKHMRNLVPDCFGDLIAMNALYRPGPLDYIPEFIDRKHGRKPVTYDLDVMEGYLKETYGITVYQEQVMLLSQQLAGFTKGQADTLRKGMGKKKKEVIDALWPKFLEGCKANGHPEEVVQKIWKDWEKFASYAFNKSHSTCYALIAYHTAYLKANYPSEFMAALLSNNLHDIKTVTLFMEECKRMGVKVLGPDVNESAYHFRVNDKGHVRFGMGAIKGVGEGAVEAIVDSREEGGMFQDPFDFIRRVDLRSANKRSLECMIQGGAWDTFKLKRSQYLTPQADGTTFMDHLVKAGQRYQQGSSGPTLFSDSEEIQVSWPTPPETVTWSTMEALRRERDLIGMYVSANPLDDYFVELRFFSKGHLGMLEDLEPLVGRKMALGGICSKVRHQVSRTGKAWGAFTMEDYHGNYEFRLFGENYLKFKHLLEDDLMLFISGAVTERSWRNKEDGTETRRVEFQVNNIELLSDIREKMAKCLTIDLALDDLDDEVLQQLNKLLAKSKSKKGCEVRFQIRDTESESEVQLPSRSMKLQPSNELLDGLSKVKGLRYHLN